MRTSENNILGHNVMKDKVAIVNGVAIVHLTSIATLNGLPNQLIDYSTVLYCIPKKKQVE